MQPVGCEPTAGFFLWSIAPDAIHCRAATDLEVGGQMNAVSACS
jgi:hypothetical protein